MGLINMTKAEIEDRARSLGASMKRFAIGFLIVTLRWCSRAGMQNPRRTFQRQNLRRRRREA
jgi:hypothetical protein